MINHKKKINKIKTQNFLDEFSIKILLQHNNFTVNDWFDFKQKIQEISKGSVEIFNVKNSLLKKSLLNFTDQEHSQFLCQGPNFLVGCKNENYLKPVWKEIQSHSKLIFISCVYNKKLLTHLDVELFLKTDNSVYSQFLQILDKNNDLSNTLEYSLKMNPLFVVPSHYLDVLEFLKQSKKEN